MKVTFRSLDSELNEVKFVSDVEKIDNIYTFIDKSCDGTSISVYDLEDEIIFTRSGKINMYLRLIKNEKTLCKYENDMGLKFEFECLCKNLEIKNNKMFFEYEMFMDGISYDIHKIWLLIR